MTDNQNNVQTSVQQVDLDIDSWLGAPGAESIVTPSEGKMKKMILLKKVKKVVKNLLKLLRKKQTNF